MSAVAVERRTSRQALSNAPEFLLAGRRLLLEVGWLPGVERVFAPSSSIARWFTEPVTHFRAQGRSMQAWVTIGVGRYQSIPETTGLVTAYVRARLLEQGFDFIEIRVRVALLT